MCHPVHDHCIGLTNESTPPTSNAVVGCRWTRDAIAKITAFVLVDAGRIGNTQILDPTALAAAMRQTPSNRGLNADKPDENLRYNYAFWAKVYPGNE